ncbi:MAG: PLP-dependent aminotransferase family protein [Gemmatimonadales bacterium]
MATRTGRRGRRVAGLVPHVSLEPGPEPLFEQVYAHLREGIVSGRLAPGTRLAGSRVLAAELGISRFTVVSAIERLLAEGYLRSSHGAGTWVTATLPERRMVTPRPSAGSGRRVPTTDPPPRLAARGAALCEVVITGPRADDTEARAFRPRRPPLDLFPLALWAKLLRRQWSAADLRHLDYGDPAGAAPLRCAIAEHVRAARGLACTPSQVIVTSGAQQAVDLLLRLLLDPGDAAWIEEPGYLDLRAALIAAGARLVPVPVDDEGLDVAAGEALEPAARLAVVSPSHQFPSGSTLSAARRMALLAWARRANAWVLEDDNDCYFRYRGRPLSALQQLDAEAAGGSPQRVVYIGTFSRTMFPSLRLGYCVVPESLVEPVANARAVAGRNSPFAEQAALAAFIAEGHYDRHLRRVRLACQERHDALVHSAERVLGERLRLGSATAGTHVLAWPAEGLLSRRARAGRSAAVAIAERAAEAGLVTFPVSRYCLTPPARDGLVLGYGGLSPSRIRPALNRLSLVIDALRGR